REAEALAAIRQMLMAHLGDSTGEGLSVQTRLLVEQAALKAVVLRQMGAHALRHGVLQETGEPVPPLGEHYLAFSNSLRHDLLALGLARRAKDVTPTVGEIRARYD